MKAEELMVGDIVVVTNRDDDRDFEIMKVTDFLNLLSHGYLIDPVPITPEFLEKNGFKSKVNYFGRTGWDWGDELIHAFVFKHDDGRYVIICENMCEGRYDAFIDSVHELQHALRLCKIEKEIEP